MRIGKIYIIICLVVLPCFAIGQNQNIKEYQTLADKYIKEGNANLAAQYLNKIAYYYWDKEQLKEALDYFGKSIEFTKKTGNKNALMTINSNVGMLYSDLEQYEKSLTALQNALQYARELKDRARIAGCLTNIANVLGYLNRYKDANDKLDEALSRAQELNDLRLIRSCYAGLAENYKKLGNNDKSYEYFNLFTSFDSRIKAEEMKKMEVENQVKVAMANAQKKEKELELMKQTLKLKGTQDSLSVSERINKEREMQIKYNMLTIKEKEQQLKLERWIRLTMAGIILFVLLFSIILFKLFLDKKKTNKLLEAQNVLLQHQKDEIEHKNKIITTSNHELAKKNKQIVESLKYASRIQEAILPSKKAISENFPQSFILYKPRDIVSGDFYWFSKQGDYLFISAVDCTGHSVPGAFMSMIGNTMLNEIVNDKKIFDPGKIVQALNTGIISALRQQDDQNSSDDGMDMSICRVDLKNKELQVACANHSPYIYSDGELKLIEGNSFSIGGFVTMKMNPTFKTISLPIHHDTTIYLFSDGFCDQFGGPNNKKFSARQFRDILEQNASLSMPEQKDAFANSFNTWMGDNKQIDDILVIGIKVGVGEVV